MCDDDDECASCYRLYCCTQYKLTYMLRIHCRAVSIPSSQRAREENTWPALRDDVPGARAHALVDDLSTVGARAAGGRVGECQSPRQGTSPPRAHNNTQSTDTSTVCIYYSFGIFHRRPCARHTKITHIFMWRKKQGTSTSIIFVCTVCLLGSRASVECATAFAVCV